MLSSLHCVDFIFASLRSQLSKDLLLLFLLLVLVCLELRQNLVFVEARLIACPNLDLFIEPYDLILCYYNIWRLFSLRLSKHVFIGILVSQAVEWI